MLIARAPFRISYAGGGTDLESYYAEHGGLVLSVAIDKYFYVIVTPEAYGSLQVSSSDYRAFMRWDELEEPMGIGDEVKHARAALDYFGIKRGYSVFMSSQVPGGSGLGTSSAVAVALVKALSTLKQARLTRQEVAEIACELEIRRLGMPIGRQDQFASAFGGLNVIEFTAVRTTVAPLEIPAATVRELEQSTLLFYTGLSHESSDILREQQERTADPKTGNVESLHRIKKAAQEAKAALEGGRVLDVGEIMHAAWQEKKSLSSGITNAKIDEAYEAARSAGAVGGKIAGAGGGGFLFLICAPRRQRAVTNALHGLGLVRFNVHFDFAGARVLMNNAAD